MSFPRPTEGSVFHADVLWLADLLFKMVPERSAAVLSRVSEPGGRCAPFEESTFCRTSSLLATAIVLLAVSSMLVNRQYIVNKVSLNQNTHNTGLCIDPLEKKHCDQRLAGT